MLLLRSFLELDILSYQSCLDGIQHIIFGKTWYKWDYYTMRLDEDYKDLIEMLNL